MTPFFTEIMLATTLFPLLLLPMLAFRKTSANALHLAPWAALPALAASIFTPLPSADIFLPWLLLGSRFGLDPTGSIFWLLAAILWTISGLYAKHYVDAKEQKPFFLFFLAAMAGNFLLILAQDVAGFYLGFTLMSFASYGLIVSRKNAQAFRAGRIYILFIVLGETALFSGMLIAVALAGSAEFTAVRAALADADNSGVILMLMLIGFGIKAGVIGLHSWLPLAHPIAPVPASAVLSGTMIKAGLLGWVRLFPFGSSALTDWGSGLIILGLVSSFYGAVLGITQRDPKTLLAYSSISQIGVMTVLFGLGASSPGVWPFLLPVIAFYALHHGLSKGALFLGSGLYGSTHTAMRRWVWTALWLPALAMAGAPWSSGMYAKLLVKTYAVYAPATLAPILPMLLTAGSVATALMMARFLYLLRPSSAPYGKVPQAGMLRPWGFLLITIILLPWLQGYSAVPVTPPLLLQSLWPLLAAFFTAVIVLRTGILRNISPVPAGDILIVMEYGVQRLTAAVAPAAAWLSLWRIRTQSHIRRRRAQLSSRLMAVAVACEHRLSQWTVSMTLFVTLILVIIALQLH